MSDKSKSGGKKPHPNPDDNGGKKQECKISGEAHVRGEIEVDISPSAIEKYKSAKEQPSSRDNKRFIVEILTLIAVVIYAGLTAYQAYLTRSANKLTREAISNNTDQFIVGQRPIIGIPGADIYISTDNHVGTFYFITNYGKTPASTQNKADIFVGSDAMKKADDFFAALDKDIDAMRKKTLKDISGQVIYPWVPSDPKQAVDHYHYQPAWTLTPDELKDARTARGHIVSVLRVYYWDAYGRFYYTDYCMSSAANVSQQPKGTRFNYCDDHNQAH